MPQQLAGQQSAPEQPSDEIRGLSSPEAAARLRQYGPNEPAPRVRRSALLEYIGHFTNPLVAILLAASVVSIFAGEKTNAGIIIVIVLISVTLDYVQEHRSGVAADKLREAVALRATVIRDGVPVTVSSKEVVPGDIVQLAVGDMVPADGNIIQSRNFFVLEAALTGESLPVEKSSESTAHNGTRVFLGTNVTGGEALIEITETGASTEFAHVAKALTSKPLETEFERGARGFSLFIMRIVVGLVLFVFLVNVAYKRDTLESFLFAVALAVGLTPGLLPMIVSVALAHGAERMAKKQVIVKHMAAIENLGSMDILCTDKTGTLTEGTIVLAKYVDLEGRASDPLLLFALMNARFQTGLRSPLDQSLLTERHPDLGRYSRVDEIPFDFDRRCLSVVARGPEATYLVTKGAPESIRLMCDGVANQGQSERFDQAAGAKYDETFSRLSAEGYRVIAVAYKTISDAPSREYSTADETGLLFLGFLAFLDPPKHSVVSTLKAMKRDGVDVKVLTGDNEIVTAKICRDVGLEVREIVTGSELEEITDEALMAVAVRTTVFARVSPDQKRRIVVALKRSRHAVGFMGDGINDAPALRAADVGLSVDTAVDVAREAADFILLRKSLNVIHTGIAEGRRTFGNIMKYVLMGTSSNFGNMFSMAGASLILPFLPMLPPQILLNNLLYDLSQVTIPGDRIDVDYLQKPKKWNIKLIRQYMVWMGLISSVFDFLTFGLLICVFHAGQELFHTGWFIESLATQTLVILVIRTRKIPWRSRPSRGLVLSTIACVSAGVLLPFTPAGRLLEFSRPPLSLMGAIALFVLAYLAVAEVVKRWLYRGHFDTV